MKQREITTMLNPLEPLPNLIQGWQPYNYLIRAMLCEDARTVLPFFTLLLMVDIVFPFFSPNLLGTKGHCCCCCTYVQKAHSSNVVHIPYEV